VILGDLGSERRLEFAILGDTVNVASRLEQLTRTLGCRIAVSDDVMSAMREQTENVDEIGRSFRDMGPQSLRGRAQSITVWGANA
jgi:adenylate cyclase